MQARAAFLARHRIGDMPFLPHRAPEIAALLALVCSTQVMAVEPQRWTIDPAHTRVEFHIARAGFSHVVGTISGSTGELQFDPDNWQSARLDVQVPMDRLDMGNSGWPASFLAPRFLDVQRYPQARLVVDHLSRIEGNHGRACGNLTLHGVTRPLCMDITLNRSDRVSLPPLRRTLGFSATARLKRSEYGMSRLKSLTGDFVDLRIEAELLGSEDGNPAANPTAASAR